MKISSLLSISVLSALGVSATFSDAGAQPSGRRGTVMHSSVSQSSAKASASVRIISPVGIMIKYIGNGALTNSGRFFPNPNVEAQYITDGETGYVIAVSLPDRAVMTSFEKMLSNLSVNDIHTDIPVNGSNLTAVSGRSGELRFSVAFEAPIESDTPPGDYTGSFTLTVNYN